jgi:Xaa-Pro aminopeptidase
MRRPKHRTYFSEVRTRALIRPGVTESEINANVYALAAQMYGVTRHWHKRIVRAGPNTLFPYDENPPDLTVAEDDIVFLDFGPGFCRVGSGFWPHLRGWHRSTETQTVP